jgi:hypothetical protein
MGAMRFCGMTPPGERSLNQYSIYLVNLKTRLFGKATKIYLFEISQKDYTAMI